MKAPYQKGDVFDRIEARLDSLKFPETPQEARARRSRFKNGLRWLFFVPAAIGAYFGASLLLAVIDFITPEHYSIPRFAVPFWNGVVSTIAFMYAGMMVAPSARFAVSIFLTLLHTGFAVWLLLAWNENVNSDPFWKVALASGLGMVTTVWACIAVWQHEHRNP